MRNILHFRRALADKQPGQILVILALAMVGLLVAAGLAVDGGVLFVRKSQLDRATDAAALAGVVTLSDTDSVDDANVRGLQLMGANNVLLAQPAVEGCTSGWEATYDYCGEESPGNVPGSIRYTVRTEWESPTYFMGLVGLDTIRLRSLATAEYFTLVDMFANSLGGQGIVRASNQSIFGPESCIDYGDAYTPGPSGNPNWPELEGAYTYRIVIPESYTYDKVRIEIFDPDTGNQGGGTNIPVYSVEGTRTLETCGDTTTADEKNTCLLTPAWGGTGDNPNPYWFRRVDETRSPCSTNYCSGRDCSWNTTTLYRLYYLEQDVDGTLSEVDLAYYIGKRYYTSDTNYPEAAATDLMWVSPGSDGVGESLPAMDVFSTLDGVFGGYGGVSPDLHSDAEPPVVTEVCDTYRMNNPAFTDATACSPTTDNNFIIDLTTEVPDIFVSGSGQRDLYLDVRGLTRASENGFELWAGPPPSAGSKFVVPSDINARQVYILANAQHDEVVHDSNGVAVFGMGHLPMNTNDDIPNGVDIALAYIGPELAGQELTVEMFDSDAGAIDPILFYFDTIPTDDWAACYDDDYDGSGNRTDNPGIGEGYDYSPSNLENPCRLDSPNNWCLIDSCASWGFTRDPVVDADIPHSGYWTDPPFTFTVPSDESGIPFYGGRLMVRYRSGSNDTFGWKLSLNGRPYLTQ